MARLMHNVLLTKLTHMVMLTRLVHLNLLTQALRQTPILLTRLLHLTRLLSIVSGTASVCHRLHVGCVVMRALNLLLLLLLLIRQPLHSTLPTPSFMVMTVPRAVTMIVTLPTSCTMVLSVPTPRTMVKTGFAGSVARAHVPSQEGMCNLHVCLHVLCHLQAHKT